MEDRELVVTRLSQLLMLAVFIPVVLNAQAAATLTKYCVACHNQKTRTAGFVLDAAAVSNPAASAQHWEKVIQKLRSRAMPPAGVPRPDEPTYDALASFIEGQIDREAVAKPNPGELPLLHRLTRTEYQNAIRDLLALDKLPKEMDYSFLLPADNVSSGFDNIADLLFVSPTAMERYLKAAQKISALAVGDPASPVMVNIFRLSDEQPQDTRVDQLPFGTRGGVAIESEVPLDGEYKIKVELFGFSRQDEQLEILVDGARVHLADIKANARADRGTVRGGEIPRAYKPMEFRVPLKAGPRVLGITFIQKDETRDEETVRPHPRTRGPLLAIDTVTVSGPYGDKGTGDTPGRERIFICRPASKSDELPCTKRILTALTRRAYRRPVTDSDVAPLLKFYTAGRETGSLETGIEHALERMLVSPQFLFRIEREPEELGPGTPYKVSDLELASRLSFFIWSSIPDDELFGLATRGQLRAPGILEKQVQRMMADARSESLVTNFAEQWLYLRDLDAKKPDELVFQDFDENLRQAFRHETDLFLDSILRGNHSVLDLLTATYTFVNDRLAHHYGIPNIEGSYFRRVELPVGSPRAGLLGQGSILTITSYATRTSPVVRGKWVLENLLNSAPPPPPPNVPALKTEGHEPGKTLTMREAMTVHRENPACAGCHARMDPIGFAMENLDAIGRWRDLDNGSRIDASGVLPDGTKFDGMSGMLEALLRHPQQFVSTVAEKLLMYAIGRNVQYFDQPAVRAIVHEAASQNNTFESMVLGVAKSTPFQMRLVRGSAKAPPKRSIGAVRGRAE
jgi:hypothetical protein